MVLRRMVGDQLMVEDQLMVGDQLMVEDQLVVEDQLGAVGQMVGLVWELVGWLVVVVERCCR